jgi:hypothetical protein
MQADFAVELGNDDETLDFPWVDPDGRLHYYDLKRHPEFLSQLPEVRQFPELREFLASINSSVTPFETAKCDAWPSMEMNVEDEIFDAACKFASYVDVLFSEDPGRFSFEKHESLVQRTIALLKKVPEIPASAELIVRHCYFPGGSHTSDASQPSKASDAQAGFYVTAYVFGYGEEEEQARRQWAVALRLVGNALLQASKRDA